MSTRAVIARKTKGGFKGRYHHWDGYPTALGATLFGIYNGHFKRDGNAMLKTLLDDHPAGWSTINGKDWNLEPGYGTKSAPECYCHGGRKESGNVITHKNASGCGCEWAYVFDGNGMMEVYSSYCPSGAKMIGAFGMGDENASWHLMVIVNLNGSKPNWERIEAGEVEPVVTAIQQVTE